MKRLLILAALLLPGGCTDQIASVVKYAEATGRYVALTEPILRGAYDMELEACHQQPTGTADILCQERVNARWAPILETLGTVHETFCAIDAERCKP